VVSQAASSIKRDLTTKIREISCPNYRRVLVIPTPIRPGVKSRALVLVVSCVRAGGLWTRKFRFQIRAGRGEGVFASPFPFPAVVHVSSA